MLGQPAEFQDFASNDNEAYEIYLAVREWINEAGAEITDVHPRQSESH